MLFLKTKFESKCTTPCCDLIKEIDKRLAKYSDGLLDNIRYSFNNKFNYEAYEDLITYRDILTRTIHCSNCLCDVNIDVIVSKIRKLTNSIC